MISCALLVLVAGSSGDARGASGDTKSPGVEVSVRAGRLVVRAREAPLAEVLEAIGRHARVRMVLGGDLDTRVTETLVDVSLEEALRRLTRLHSVVLIYEEPASQTQDPRLSEVRVLGLAGRPARFAQRPPGVTRGDSRAAALPAAAVGAAGLGQHADGPAASSVRERAVWELVRQHGVLGAAETLRAMVRSDPSPRVRRAALMALRRAPGAYGVAELLEAAIRDPAPIVKTTAISALASMRSAEAGNALRSMLHDPDPLVRSVATRAFALWERGAP